MNRLRSWWQEANTTLSPDFAYLAGRPRSFESIHHALESFPLRQRHLLGLMLSIRSASKLRVDTRAFAATQRRQMQHVSSFLNKAPRDVLEPF